MCVYIYKSVYFRRLKDTKTNKKLFYHLSTYINMGVGGGGGLENLKGF